MDKVLNKIYYNPSTGYCGAQSLYFQAIKVKPSITFNAVKKWLAGQPTYTLHKTARRNYTRNRVLVSFIDEQWQLDLADLSNLKKFNDGYKFILTCIDIFSKVAWAVAVKSKSAANVTEAFESILKESGRRPFRVQTDKGKEFLNKEFQKLLSKNSINFFTTNTETKCSVVERFNRTLKEKMFKYFTKNNTHRYVDILPQLMTAYNNSKHRTIGMAPSNVSTENQQDILQRVFSLNPKNKVQFKFNVGDTVRISKIKQQFEKGYLPNWTEEVFTVHDRLARTPPVYVLRDKNEQVVQGVFYNEEIQKIDETSEYYIVEKILRKRKKAGKMEYLVKYRGYPSSFNSWVTELVRL